MHKNLLAKLQRCAELLGVASMQAQLPELLEKITDIALAAKDPAIKAAQRTARKNPRPPKAERKNSKPQTQIVAPQGSENSREQSAPDSPRLKKDDSSPHKKRSRTIPAATRREVQKRADFQCEYRSSQNKRCTQKTFLHIDHITSFAKDGSHESANLQVYCQAHNHLKGALEFGLPWKSGES